MREVQGMNASVRAILSTDECNARSCVHPSDLPLNAARSIVSLPIVTLITRCFRFSQLSGPNYGANALPRSRVFVQHLATIHTCVYDVPYVHVTLLSDIDFTGVVTHFRTVYLSRILPRAREREAREREKEEMNEWVSEIETFVFCAQHSSMSCTIHKRLLVLTSSALKSFPATITGDVSGILSIETVHPFSDGCERSAKVIVPLQTTEIYSLIATIVREKRSVLSFKLRNFSRCLCGSERSLYFTHEVVRPATTIALESITDILIREFRKSAKSVAWDDL